MNTTDIAVLTSDRPRPVSRRPATSGEDELMEVIYRVHAKPIFGYLLRLNMGNRREAEDLLQETLLRALLCVRSGKLDIQTIRPWLYTVARRLVIDAHRARRSRPPEAFGNLVADIASPKDVIEQLVHKETVRAALMELTPQHRNSLFEIYFNQRSTKEAAEVLGIPEGTVKSRVHYGLQALRTALV